MPHDRPLKLKVADNDDFAVPVAVLGLLAVLAALLGPWPLQVVFLPISVLAIVWGMRRQSSSNCNHKIIALSVFMDGRIRLESEGENTVGGYFEGQQWCTHQLAILRIRAGGVNCRLLILPVQQNRIDDFRRLNMWLRQGVCIDKDLNCGDRLIYENEGRAQS